MSKLTNNELFELHFNIIKFIKDNPGITSNDFKKVGYKSSESFRGILRIMCNEKIIYRKGFLNNHNIIKYFYYITNLGKSIIENNSYILNSGNNRSCLKPTERQNEIIIGGLLGDSYLHNGRKKSNVCFATQRSIKDIKYLEWQINELKNLCTEESNNIKIKTAIGKADRLVKINHKICSFNTKRLPSLNIFREEWYPDGKKIVPRNFNLTPLMVAVWFADDGFLELNKSCNSYRVGFCTNGFTYDDVIYLKNMLNNLFNASFYINKSTNKYKNEDGSKKQYIIKGGSISADILYKSISGYLKEMNMERKIPNINLSINNENFKKRLKLLKSIKENNNSISLDELYKLNFQYKERSIKHILIVYRNKDIVDFIRYGNKLTKVSLTKYGLECLENENFYNPYRNNKKYKYE